MSILAFRGLRECDVLGPVATPPHTPKHTHITPAPLQSLIRVGMPRVAAACRHLWPQRGSLWPTFFFFLNTCAWRQGEGVKSIKFVSQVVEINARAHTPWAHYPTQITEESSMVEFKAALSDCHVQLVFHLMLKDKLMWGHRWCLHTLRDRWKVRQMNCKQMSSLHLV